MDGTYKTQSLLPWLVRGASKIHLEFSLESGALEGYRREGFPFRLLDASSPLFRLHHASFRISPGTPVKEVFLLVQKDRCSFAEKSTAFNNSQIDTIWLEALKVNGDADGLDAFAGNFGKFDDQGHSPLWRSLFYCRKRQCYFHPPCPQCGNLLELCRDDAHLESLGLPLYSTTLERFLYCPVCHNKLADSFLYYHNDANDAYPIARNCRALVEGFALLLEKNGAGEDFPCQSCSEQKDCYGSELAFTRISPFAFYPFRLLIADAAQLPAQDFLAMLSGASCTELEKLPHLVKEPGRLACVESIQQQGVEGVTLLFQNDSRCFLELLYLKLALLEQLTSIVFKARKHLKHPELRLSMDQFWVTFPDFQGLLPSFWNFKVIPLALGIVPSVEISLLRVPESLGLYSFALCWFSTLLVNKEQTAGEVQHELALLLDGENGDTGEQAFLDQASNGNGVFGPGNIFWRPQAEQVPSLWLELWRKALHLGWSLLQTSLQPTDFSDQSFAEEVRQLAFDVKSALFAAGDDDSMEIPEKTEADTTDAEILQILLSLQEKWRDEADIIGEEPQAEPQTELEAEPGMESAAISSEPEEAEADLPVEEDLEKTVILNADQLAAMMAENDQQNREDMAEEKVERTPEAELNTEEDLEKTVIINTNDLGSLLSDDKNAGQEGKPQPSATPQPENIPDDNISETVIISLEELEKLRKGKNGKK